MHRLWFDYSWKHHYCVYCLTSPDGKRYFGISRYHAERRWKNGKGYNGNNRLKTDLEMYSFACFRHEIIRDELNREEAERLEAELIRQYNTTDPEKGYNVRKGSCPENYDVYVFTFPDGKHYVGMTGKPVKNRWDYGNGYHNNRRLSEAIKSVGFDNIRKEHFSYPLSRDSAERIETALIDYFDSANPEKGYNRGHGALAEHGWQHGGETREKIRTFQLGQKKSPETKERMRKGHQSQMKKVRNVTTGMTYGSIREASEACGVSSTCIARACCGKQKSAGGCEWEFAK